MRRMLLILMSLVLLSAPVYADDIADTAKAHKLSQDDLLKLGDALYHTEGTNTCLYCHGKGGHGGNQAGAADLRHPKTWRSYQALGGDAAMQADKDKFLMQMETALLYLIRNGATSWNQKFDRKHKEIKYDWSKVVVPDKADKYNNMMKGVTSGPMRKHIKDLVQHKYKVKSGDARDIAAVAAFTYVKTLDDGSDQGGLFK